MQKGATRWPPLEMIEQVIEKLIECDVLDVLAAADAVQGKAMTDHLDDFGARALGELVGRLAAGE